MFLQYYNKVTSFTPTFFFFNLLEISFLESTVWPAGYHDTTRVHSAPIVHSHLICEVFYVKHLFVTLTILCTKYLLWRGVFTCNILVVIWMVFLVKTIRTILIITLMLSIRRSGFISSRTESHIRLTLDRAMTPLLI